MIFTPTEIAGAVLVELERHEDERGFFARAWSADELAAAGLVTGIAQCNIAFNERAGTLRGLHFQRPPHEEVKLVRCTRGAIYDVIVDLRPDSPDLPPLARGRADRGEPDDAVRPGRLRARLPDARRRDRGLLHALGAVRARGGGRRALGRPGVRDRVAAGRASDHVRERPRLARFRHVTRGTSVTAET